MVEENQGSARHLYSQTDFLFIGFIIAEIFSFAIFPGLPLLIAAAAMATQVRKSRRMKITLWVLAGVLTFMNTFPFIVGYFGWSFNQVS